MRICYAVTAGEDESLIDVYMEHKHDEGERFDWLQRPLPSDAFHYAAAEAKTVLQLYHQVRKENKDPDHFSPHQAPVPAATPLPGPATPYRSQHVERRRVLTEGLSGKQRPDPVVVQKPPAPLPRAVLTTSTMQSNSVLVPTTVSKSIVTNSTSVKKSSKKGKSWLSPCLGG